METAHALEAWNEQFAIAGLAQIVAGEGNLPRIQVTTPAASAEIYLHGAQVTSWHPAGTDEVLFLSKQSRWEQGRAIRGGIPICFPWFRAKSDNPQAPAHGVVRTRQWQLDALTQHEQAVVVTLSTTSDDASRRWWPHEFRIVHRITVGAILKLELSVTNTGAAPLEFEEALHTYFHVADAEKVRVRGLDGAHFFDNMDGNREKQQQGDFLYDRQTDNAYVNTSGTLELIDPGLDRRIATSKQHSLTSVVWNPWREGAAALADLGNDEWQQMACVEASNILNHRIVLAPAEQHTMVATLSVRSGA